MSESAASLVAGIDSTLSFADRLGALGVRLGIGRMHYTVRPGLYALGKPDAGAPVLVTANYKLTFDTLRSHLVSRDAWVLVLDTKGVNVWCAAGKGTFGTDEIVRRVEDVALAKVVSHRTLVLPQLGAPGVQAHEVEKRCGFHVVYGPVRAADLGAFFDAGMQAMPEMRRVRFDLADRLVVVPLEVVMSLRLFLLVAVLVFLLSGLGRRGYSFEWLGADGWRQMWALLAGYLAGTVGVPVFLPWLPGRAFAVKGAFAGLVVAAGVFAWGAVHSNSPAETLSAASWLLMLPALASFLGMEFTGASTYTSLSGVEREVRAAVPAQIALGAVGVVLWLLARFL